MAGKSRRTKITKQFRYGRRPCEGGDDEQDESNTSVVFARTDSEGIKRYMHDWIQHGGRVAIWTRDMSWAQNAQTRRLLREKAERRELILCLPEPNELARELSAAGAEICAYGAQHLESPASRFTIAFFGR